MPKIDLGHEVQLVLEQWLDNTNQWFLASRKGWLMFCKQIKDHRINMHALFCWLRANGYVRSGTSFGADGTVTAYTYKLQYHGKARPVTARAFLDDFWDEVTTGDVKA